MGRARPSLRHKVPVRPNIRCIDITLRRPATEPRGRPCSVCVWLSLARRLRGRRDPGCAIRSSEAATCCLQRRRSRRIRLPPQSVSPSNSSARNRASRKRIGSGTSAVVPRRRASARRLISNSASVRGIAAPRSTRFEVRRAMTDATRFHSRAVPALLASRSRRRASAHASTPNSFMNRPATACMR